MNRRTLTAHAEGAWKLAGGFYQAPATLMVESVACGSAGCLLWTAGTILGMAEKWHNIPLTLDHPQSGGRPVSVNASTAIRNAYTIGQVVDPRYCHSTRGLKATLRIPANHPRRREAMALKEVSIGVFSDEVAASGEFKGKRYAGKVISATPDHCAIVDRGACDWETGCGVRANSEVDELLAIAANTLTNMVNEILGKGENTMANHAGEGLYPPEVYAAQERNELQILKEWENFDGLPPMEITALRLKHAGKRQGKGGQQDYGDEALYPPEVTG